RALVLFPCYLLLVTLDWLGSTNAEPQRLIGNDGPAGFTRWQFDRVEVGIRAAALHRREEIVHRLALQGPGQVFRGGGAGGDLTTIVAVDRHAIEERQNDRSVHAGTAEMDVPHARIGDVPEIHGVVHTLAVTVDVEPGDSLATF